jgi:hypothetical protein
MELSLCARVAVVAFACGLVGCAEQKLLVHANPALESFSIRSIGIPDFSGRLVLSGASQSLPRGTDLLALQQRTVQSADSLLLQSLTQCGLPNSDLPPLPVTPPTPRKFAETHLRLDWPPQNTPWPETPASPPQIADSTGAAIANLGKPTHLFLVQEWTLGTGVDATTLYSGSGEINPEGRAGAVLVWSLWDTGHRQYVAYGVAEELLAEGASFSLLAPGALIAGSAEKALRQAGLLPCTEGVRR